MAELVEGTLAKGEEVVVSVLSGYKTIQSRPFACRIVCECGGCNGTSTRYAGVVERLVNWADNSREAFVRCEDGKQRVVMITPPSGDACY